VIDPDDAREDGEEDGKPSACDDTIEQELQQGADLDHTLQGSLNIHCREEGQDLW
jgi:hypothetical protein